MIGQDDFIWYTQQAARAYRVDEDAVSAAAARLGAPDGRRQAREICELHLALLAVAAAHQWCRAGCETCVAIRESIAVATAVLRTEVDGQLRLMFDGPARGVAMPDAASWAETRAGAVYRAHQDPS